eukprot:TRINITY_DN653_c4_g1_i1.p1 TRINITY_DN653_c4_g1~~TRINITY_DN653_c4_g1_i1.p1  ORF type:complete len:735 (+),score=76.40 TRINITY_DN653_c4_g1_i1:58-2205(+)
MSVWTDGWTKANLGRYPPFKWVMLPDDTQEVSFEKFIIVSWSIAGILVAITTMFNGVTSPGAIGKFNGLLAIIGHGLLAAQIFIQRKVNRPVLEIAMYVISADIFVSDYIQAVYRRPQFWALFVVLLDICLLLRLRRPARVIIAVVITWQVVICLEDAFRWGVYDLPFTPTQEQRASDSNCEKLPCASRLSVSLTYFLAKVAIFLLDYYFTRGFADKMHTEHDKITSVIEAVEDIAKCFSKFDLQGAEHIINTTPTTFPPPLKQAFTDILRNLRVYRPYIPPAVFDEVHPSPRPLPDSPKTSEAVPGLTIPIATIVFTDIQGSTVSWEACPEGMREGLKIHNSIMRTGLATFHGYEVKTIGDAFMAAFTIPLDAVSFALWVQEELVHADWPSELLLLDHCAWQEQGPWCGLRVRIGIHCGPVDVQLNMLTKRYDYFGHTVNKAARMEGACVGGAVAVTEEVFEHLPNHLFAAGKVIQIPMGETKLRGVAGVLHPTMLLPGLLYAREDYIRSMIMVKRSDRRVVGLTSLSLGRMNDLKNVGSATVGSIEVVIPDDMDDPAEVSILMNDALPKLITSVERSQGAVVSLQGAVLGVGWNTSRPCITHAANGFAFISMVESSIGSHFVHVGLATGSVIHGVVGRKEQKFITTIGPTVKQAAALRALASNTHRFCIYSSPTPIPSSSEYQALPVPTTMPCFTYAILMKRDDRSEPTPHSP